MRHTLSVVVEDKPGVLARVASLFAQRGVNIHSLAVGPTHRPGLSVITLVVDAPAVERVSKQLHKLVNVLDVTELPPGAALEREIMLLRVETAAAHRHQVLDAASSRGARPVEIGDTSITFEAAGEPAELADLVEALRPLGLVELVQSGRIALSRHAATHPVPAAG